MREGWLLDVYPDGDDLVLWIKTRKGKVLSHRVRYPPSFYVVASRERMDHLRDRLEEEGLATDTRYECKRRNIRDQEGSEVLRVEVESGMYRAVASSLHPLERRGYRFFNIDVPRAQGFLYTHDLFPMGLVDLGPGRGIESLDDRFSVDYELPPLSEVRVEVHPGNSTDSAVESITLEGQGCTDLDGGSEEERIVRAIRTLDEIDPDVVYISGRDLSHISKRAEVRGVSHELLFGRDKTRMLSGEKEGRSYFSYGTVYYKQPYRPFFGRLRVDPENSFMYGDSGMSGLIEVSRLTKIPLQKCSTTSPGTGISSMQLDQAYREGLLVPRRKEDPEEFKTGLHLLRYDRGGFVFEPGKGFHTEVGEIDFSSMYPSIMERYNISPETVLCECCRGDAPRVPGCGYHICTRRRGLVPKVIGPLLDRRRHYKEVVRKGGDRAPEFDRRQRAIKWLLVTCFGYLGYRNARFGRVEAHEAVTAFGRDKLFRAVDVAEESGYEVLHGIVDSLWLRREGATAEDYEVLCRAIEERSGLGISLEGIYRWVFFLPSKMDPQVPVLNRYFGVFEDGEVKARGIELRRSDTPQLVKRAQLEMLEVLSRARDVEEYLGMLGDCVSIIRDYSRRLREGEVDVEDLVITRRASKAPWEYSNLSHIAVSSLKLDKIGRTVKPGQLVGYIITDASSPDPWKRAEPVELYGERSTYDADKYIDEVIGAGTTLFEGLGYDRDFMSSLVVDGSRQTRLGR